MIDRSDILERLRVTPMVTLPQAQSIIPVATTIREMMIERAEAAHEIELLRRERNELSTDLAALRMATSVRLSEKARTSLRLMLEAMEILDDLDAPGLRLLLEMNDKVAAL
jgi:hypothetical protein